MKNILVTGAGGLIGSEAVRFFAKNKTNRVYGIDNNMRMEFFGKDGDVSSVLAELSLLSNYQHLENLDIRDREGVNLQFSLIKPDAIVHCAAQPSHDKAASIPHVDFEVNANGTMNLLEATRQHAKDSPFVFCSTNKVYGDGPNTVRLIESEKRYDFYNPEYIDGIPETFSVDNCMHSLFGASKLAADIMCQEYGKYFDMNVGIFRGGCLTGPQHKAVELHGFLTYIVNCAVVGKKYNIFGYKGKQVRDQIHSSDVLSAFSAFIDNPKKGEVYNIGGCKGNSASILEIVDILEEKFGYELHHDYVHQNRAGDHICYYSDMSKFKEHYPSWSIKYLLDDIVSEIIESIA